MVTDIGIRITRNDVDMTAILLATLVTIMLVTNNLIIVNTIKYPTIIKMMNMTKYLINKHLSLIHI